MPESGMEIKRVYIHTYIGMYICACLRIAHVIGQTILFYFLNSVDFICMGVWSAYMSVLQKAVRPSGPGVTDSYKLPYGS